MKAPRRRVPAHVRHLSGGHGLVSGPRLPADSPRGNSGGFGVSAGTMGPSRPAVWGRRRETLGDRPAAGQAGDLQRWGKASGEGPPAGDPLASQRPWS